MVGYERSGAAAIVTIDRPERRNAVDGPTAAALLEAYERFAADDGASVLVLTGAGEDAFCAGADLKALATLDPDAPAGPMGFTRGASPKPAIAAIAGWGVAGEHVARALELAEAIAAFPQDTLRSDREAALAALPLADGLALEGRLGRDRLGTALEGARRFADRE